MAWTKTPDGGFYVDSTQVNVDYEKNRITLVDAGGEGDYLTLDGGTMNAGAIITGTDELTIEVPDEGESATIGATPEGVTLVHNTDSEADARIRVIQNSVEILADTTTVQLNGTGVNFGGGALSNIASIGASSSAIAFENEMDMNSHKITDMADPTNAQDAATKNYVDTHYTAATDSVLGLVRQGTSVQDATGADDVVAQLNALLASLRTSGAIASS